MTKCALCGYEPQGGFVSCRGCSVNASCQVSRCPHCGYRFVEESAIWKLIRRWRQPRPPVRAARPAGNDERRATRSLPTVG